MSEVEVNGNDVLYIGADVHESETQLAIFEPGGTLLQEKTKPKASTKLPTLSTRKGETLGRGVFGVHLSTKGQAQTGSRIRRCRSKPQENQADL